MKAARGLKVVDMHCHYLNPAVNQKIAHLNPGQYDPTTVFADAITRETNVRQMATRAPRLAGVKERLKDMDKMGIDIQAVCPAPYHFLYWTDRDLGASLTREVNDGIAKVVADTPDRFVGMGSVPLQDADLAVKELDYCVKTLGFRGIEICTSVNGRNLTDPDLKLEKFFARAEELGVVIFMHPLGWTQADRLTHHYFNNTGVIWTDTLALIYGANILHAYSISPDVVTNPDLTGEQKTVSLKLDIINSRTESTYLLAINRRF